MATTEKYCPHKSINNFQNLTLWCYVVLVPDPNNPGDACTGLEVWEGNLV